MLDFNAEYCRHVYGEQSTRGQMNFKRYIIQPLDANGEGTHFHCVGLLKDPTDISYAYLKDEKALKRAVEKNCIRRTDAYAGGCKVTIPYRVLEVSCTVI